MQEVLKEYLEAFEAGDVEHIISLFEPDGWVLSPLLGRLSVREFFPKVMAVSSNIRLTVHDILVSSKGRSRAVVYFQFEWVLKAGNEVSFECTNVFTFNPETGKLVSMVILYDTFPIRDAVGDKYD